MNTPLRLQSDSVPTQPQVRANILWLFFDQVTNLLSAFISGLITARYLGPSDFGRYSYAYSFAILFSAFYLPQLGWIALRNLSLSSKNKDEILGSVLFLRIIGGLGGLILSTVCIFAAKPADAQSVWMCIFISLSFFIMIFDTPSIYFASKVFSRPVLVLKMLVSVFRITLKIALVVFHAPIVCFAVVFLVEAVIYVCGVASLYHFNVGSMRVWKVSQQSLKALINLSFFYILASLCGFVLQKWDDLMLEHFRGYYELGIFSIAMRMTDAFSFIPIVLSTSLMPGWMRRAQNNDRKALYEGFRKLITLMTFLAVTIIVLCCASSQWLIVALVGKSYVHSADLWSLSIFWVFNIFFGTARALYWTIRGQFKTLFLMQFISMIVHMFVSTIFIYYWGTLGAIFSLYVLFFVSFVIAHFISEEIRPLHQFFLQSLNLFSGALLFKEQIMHFLRLMRKERGQSVDV